LNAQPGGDVPALRSPQNFHTQSIVYTRHEIGPEKVRPCRVAMDGTTEVKLPKAGKWEYLGGPMDGIEYRNAHRC
jgi:hypothetical protein